MNVREAKSAAVSWFEANARDLPGLRAAHFTGGVSAMADDAPFPVSKDIDLHLIFAEGSPALESDGPFAHIVEASHGGVSIEAGLKSVAEYHSAEAVLANPEIAHHLLVDSTVHDPSGLLANLRDPVRRGFARRRWVCARLDHERRGQAGAFAMLPTLRQTHGASGELNYLGYTTTFATAALQIAALRPPRLGSRSLLRLGEVLAAYDRCDLYDELLATLGLSNVGPERVERIIREAAESFDLAVEIRRTPHPFQHKLHRHLRPYFVDSCLAMLAEGHRREALLWATAFHLATADVILTDGPAAEHPLVRFRRSRLLHDLRLDTAEARAEAAHGARRVYDRLFALAAEIVAHHPGIVD